MFSYKAMGGMEEKAARAILKKACSVEYYPVNLAFGIFKHETGIDDCEKFIDLIADLSNDFYIEHDLEKGFKFYSKMLRDWWRVYIGHRLRNLTCLLCTVISIVINLPCFSGWFETRTRITRIRRIFTDPRASASSAQSVFYFMIFILTDDEWEGLQWRQRVI